MKKTQTQLPLSAEPEARTSAQSGPGRSFESLLSFSSLPLTWATSLSVQINLFFFPHLSVAVATLCRRPWVCGVSSLGIDHTQILGDTIEKIAWQKGGIFKVGVRW